MVLTTARGRVTHCFSTQIPAAVLKSSQGKGNAYTLAIVTADLEPIRAPAGIRLIDRDAAIMAPFDGGAGMALQ